MGTATAGEPGDLRQRVAELSAEVDRLRAWQAGHVCYAPAAASVCNCPAPGTAMPSPPQPCPVHGLVRIWTGYVPPYNVCGGAAGVPQTVIVNPGDEMVTIMKPTMGAAGCGNASYMVTVP